MYAAAIKALNTGHSVASEIHHYDTFGKELWLNIIFTAFNYASEPHLLFMFEDISVRKQAEDKVKLANEKLEGWVQELEQRNRNANILRQMGDLLQVCNASEEAYDVIRQFCPQLFPSTSGALLIITHLQVVEAASTWGNHLCSELVFSSEKCWSLRRGQIHIINATHPGTKCQHMKSLFTGCYLDIPMMASGKAMGLLHIEWQMEVKSVKTLKN